MKNFARIIVLSLFIVSPTIARGQGVAPAGVTRAERSQEQTTQRRADYRFPVRTLTSVLGGTVGAFGAGLLGATAFASNDCTGCEDVGLLQFLVGFGVGGF